MLASLLVALSLTTATPAVKTLDIKDSGKTVTISKNQPLHIELSECGSCGYSWKTTAKPDPKVLKRLPNTQNGMTCQPPCTGGSFTTVFRYDGKATGRTTLKLEYFGPGKKKSSKTFRLTVKVR